MKAIRKSDSKVIEVTERTSWNGEKIYTADGTFYRKHELDFSVGVANEAEGEVISGWVARDKKDNTLNLHAEEPYRTQSGYQQGDEPDWWESACASFLPLDKGLFPTLTWDSEPIEVEITIKPKKKSSTK